MDTMFSVEVQTDGYGLVWVVLRDGEGTVRANTSRQFDVDDAENMIDWINEQVKTAAPAAVLMGLTD